MAATEIANQTTRLAVTETRYEDFWEVKAAIMLERIFVPILFAVGWLGNILCFATLVFTSLRSTSTCIYMAAIAPLDCIILSHGLCMVISRYVGDATFFMHTDWNCGFQHFIFYFAIHFDVLVLLAMTVDRFIVVKFPLKAQSLSTPKSAVRVIIGLGLFSFALNFQIFFNRRLLPTGNVDNPLRCWYIPDVQFFMNRIYTVIDATIYSFIPCVALITLNLLIIRQLRQSLKFSKQFTDSASQGDSGGAGSAKKPAGGTNITLMLLLISFGFLVLTSPIVIFLTYQRYFWTNKTTAERAQSRLILAFVESVMYSNHAVNFLLYTISGRRFRQELKQLLQRLPCC